MQANKYSALFSLVEHIKCVLYCLLVKLNIQVWRTNIRTKSSTYCNVVIDIYDSMKRQAQDCQASTLTNKNRFILIQLTRTCQACLFYRGKGLTLSKTSTRRLRCNCKFGFIRILHQPSSRSPLFFNTRCYTFWNLNILEIHLFRKIEPFLLTLCNIRIK